ncbi:TerC family protein [Cohnella zeiphila]|uniref:TerC family protein n=1 Tax=Cohnella zeiphila TaxID=2761120 RepID=A0A7X0VU58_9BACL|nr:TerC family protein [Cohnella zeiphila]MBB6730674.1 TerC family protein [Cohnella zeiphila]
MEQNALLLLEIMLINIVLSGDNAVVIAMASRNLPVPQRKKAVYWGTLGAVALRIALTVVAVFLLRIPFVEIAGALLLLYVAVRLLTDDNSAAGTKGAASVFKAVAVILTADLIMSLDNVVAVASIARGNYGLMAVGIALSIPLIIWCSQWIAKVLNALPALVYIGAGILGYTAGEMLAKDDLVRKLMPADERWIGIAIAGACGLGVMLAGWALRRRKGDVRHSYSN